MENSGSTSGDRREKPGFLQGAEIFKTLGAASESTDDSTSSYWQQMHSDFAYVDGELLSAKGFGTKTPRAAGLLTPLHWWLQRPYIADGANFPSFQKFLASGKFLTQRHDRAFDYDALRQVLTVSLIEKYAPQTLSGDGVIAVIGDGFAMLSSLFLSANSRTRVILVNLTKTLLVDLIYFNRAFPDTGFAPVRDADEMSCALKNQEIRLIAVQADNCDILRSAPVILAANLVSMQEMNPPIIARYFDVLRASASRETLFYCCNRVEKTLPNGTVLRFADYPWRAEDVVLLDELCPWHRNYYSIYPPFYRPFDGPIHHRLASLSKSEKG